MAENWCSEHNVAFFKKGGMRGYAHPIGDTGKWCNKPQEAEESTKGKVDMSAMEKSAKEGKPFEERPSAPTRKASEGKNKAFALSYAKDLAVSGVIDRIQILTWAELFDGWLNGDIYIPDKVVAGLFSKYVAAAEKEV